MSPVSTATSCLSMKSSYERSQRLSDGHLYVATSPSESTRSFVSSYVSPGTASEQTSPDMYSQYGHSRDASFEFTGTTPVQAHSGFNGIIHQQDVNNLYHGSASQLPYGFEYDTVPYSTPRSHIDARSKATIRDRYATSGVPRRKPGRPRTKSIPTDEELQAQREKKSKPNVA